MKRGARIAATVALVAALVAPERAGAQSEGARGAKGNGLKDSDQLIVWLQRDTNDETDAAEAAEVCLISIQGNPRLTPFFKALDGYNRTLEHWNFSRSAVKDARGILALRDRARLFAQILPELRAKRAEFYKYGYNNFSIRDPYDLSRTIRFDFDDGGVAGERWNDLIDRVEKDLKRDVKRVSDYVGTAGLESADGMEKHVDTLLGIRYALDRQVHAAIRTLYESLQYPPCIDAATALDSGRFSVDLPPRTQALLFGRGELLETRTPGEMARKTTIYWVGMASKSTSNASGPRLDVAPVKLLELRDGLCLVGEDVKYYPADDRVEFAE